MANSMIVISATCAMHNNSMQRTALRAAADAERSAANVVRMIDAFFCYTPLIRYRSVETGQLVMNDTRRKPLLIVITGPPGTGKTTLSRRLGTLLNLPVLQRDAIKERLFDTLGIRDRTWSRQLGGASYEVLFYTLGLLLETRQPCIVESNFQGEPATTNLRTLAHQHEYQLCQILCCTTPSVLIARLRQRTQSGERHPGHADYEDIDQFEAADIQGYYEPLALDGPHIDVDTSQFEAIDYEGLVRTIGMLVGRASIDQDAAEQGLAADGALRPQDRSYFEA
jgi:predicted kinase